MKISIRYLILSLAVCIVFPSCTESFKIIDVKKFNKKIAKRVDINSPEELIKLYYNYPASEGTPNLDIQTKQLEGSRVEITLIHSGLNDDSQSAVKLVMTADRIGQRWTFIELKENWRCWSDNNQTSWGTTLCP